MYDFFNRGIEFRIGDFPVTLHWTLFLFLLDAFRYLPYPALLLLGLASFVLVILVHELGHACFCWRRKYAVDGILVHYWGGECVHEAAEYRQDEIAIAAGGIVFQLGLACLAGLALVGLGPGLDSYSGFFLGSRLIRWNLFMAAFNLLPVPGFDGYKLYHAIDWEGLRYRLGKGKAKGGVKAEVQARRKKAVPGGTSRARATTKAAAPVQADPDQARRLSQEIMAEARREFEKGKGRD